MTIRRRQGGEKNCSFLRGMEQEQQLDTAKRFTQGNSGVIFKQSVENVQRDATDVLLKWGFKIEKGTEPNVEGFRSFKDIKSCGPRVIVYIAPESLSPERTRVLVSRVNVFYGSDDRQRWQDIIFVEMEKILGKTERMKR